MEIGGFFPYEKTQDGENGYVESLGQGTGDVRHLMSGRCAIYLCLQDSMLTDSKRTAYLPAYTCETVTGCFVKAGYTILYYDVDEHLVPVFDAKLIDKISFLLICGYYGFTTFDTVFADKCRQQGVTVMQDITHTAFSLKEVYKDADYIAVSLRKWMGVISGGLAVKRNGTFGVEPVAADEKHLKIRDHALQTRLEYEQKGDEELKKESYDAFWKAEWMLREIFGMQGGDDKSMQDILHYPLDKAVAKRRENYGWLLKHLPRTPGVKPVFTVLPENACPMFFAFLCEDRDSLMEHLAEYQIPPKVYWPVPPYIQIEDYVGAHYIYDHIMSVSCDQRFSAADMQKIVEAFKDYRHRSTSKSLAHYAR